MENSFGLSNCSLGSIGRPSRCQAARTVLPATVMEPYQRHLENGWDKESSIIIPVNNRQLSFCRPAPLQRILDIYLSAQENFKRLIKIQGVEQQTQYLCGLISVMDAFSKLSGKQKRFNRIFSRCRCGLRCDRWLCHAISRPSTTCKRFGSLG